METKFLIFLSLVLLISGCTIPGFSFGPTVESEPSDIVVIKEFSAIPSTVSPGQPIKLVTFVENTGTTTVGSGINLITVELFDYCKGLFTVQEMTCPGDIIGDRPELKETVCLLSKLLPGQIAEVDWVIIPEEVELKTVCPSDGMKVLVLYPFNTTSLTTLQLINQKELQQQIERGNLKPVESYIIRGEGPIKPILTVEDKQPIAIIDTQEGPKGTTVLALQIENTGKGFLQDGRVDAKKIKIDFRDLKIKIKNENECNFEKHPDAQGRSIYKPKGDSETGPYGIAGEDIEIEFIKLIKDKSPKLFCEIEIHEAVPQVTTHTITVTIDEYFYEFRDTEKVTVEPKF